MAKKKTKEELEAERPSPENPNKGRIIPKKSLATQEEESKSIEERRREVAAAQDIKQREKLASAQGISSKAAAQQLIPQREAQNIAAVAEQQLTAQKPQVKEQLQQAGALDQVTTTEATPLDPEARTGFAEFPILGASIEAGASGYGDPLLEGIYEKLGRQKTDMTFQGENVLPDPQTLRDEALVKIREKSFQEGISKGEQFGSFVESIPIVGSLVSKYAGGLIEAPYQNVKTIQQNINAERERAVNLVEKTRMGAIEPENSLVTLQTMQDNIAKMEGRLKLLINSSAILRANSDEINKLEEDIWRAKQVVEFSRQAVAIALTRKITGTGTPIPTDQQLLSELNK